MAKPNLTSIFTSTNQYSVLKLLKALCDAVDNIDYTDNTEFTNFKEQVNATVASLEQSIMNNENAISDLNTVTGNNSTEINSIKNKISGINTDASGNVAVGKNLAIDGKVFTLNGKHWGIMPVYTTINNNTSERGFIIYSDRPGPYNPAPGVNRYSIKGIYADSYGDVSVLSVSTNNTDWYSVENDILYIKNQEAYNNFQKGSINLGIEKQNKLYRHVLNLSNNNYMYSGYIVYISTSNLKVNSLEGLTTLLRPSTNYIYPLTGTCTGLDTRDAIQFGSKNLYIKSFDKISYEDNIWYFKDNYGDKETFDEVSDTVTPL